jgi:heat-inducible transcriptional repressor
MSFKNLSDREKEILKILIDHYIGSAEPVGSRILAKKYDLGLSPATIRNTIKDLEELELVIQPHTSAGRIPTKKGYRLYVDYLLRPDRLSNVDREKIEKNIQKDYAGVDQVLEQTARVLGNVSHQLGIAVSPRFESGILTRLELIPVAERRVLVVLAIKSGLARTILLEVETDLTDRALSETAAILNERLCGLSVGDIRRTIKDRLKEPTMGDPRLIKILIDASDDFFAIPEDNEIHLGGAMNLISQPEFNSPDKIKDVIKLVEERQTIYELVSNSGIVEGITVTIGIGHRKKGNQKEAPEELSVMSKAYTAGKVKGVVGIIGPTRMPYSKLVGIVDYTAKRLSEILSE